MAKELHWRCLTVTQQRFLLAPRPPLPFAAATSTPCRREGKQQEYRPIEAKSIAHPTAVGSPRKKRGKRGGGGLEVAGGCVQTSQPQVRAIWGRCSGGRYTRPCAGTQEGRGGMRECTVKQTVRWLRSTPTMAARPIPSPSPCHWIPPPSPLLSTKGRALASLSCVLLFPPPCRYRKLTVTGVEWQHCVLARHSSLPYSSSFL